MSSRTRRTAVVLLGLAALGTLAWLSPAWAQKMQGGGPRFGGAVIGTPAEPDGGDDAADSIQLPRDARQKKKLDAARDYIKEKSWGEACRILQSLLDAEQDAFFPVPGKDANKTSRTERNIKVEADRLLASFPPEGLEHYRLSYGAAARDLLNAAKANGSAEQLSQVVKRYLYTDAGREALRLLATHCLDRGDYRQAAPLFARLRELSGGEPLSPTLLVQCALAFHRTAEGEAEDAKKFRPLEEEVWKELAEQVGTSVRLGDHTVALADLRREVRRNRSASFDVLLANVPGYGGGPSRTHQGVGDQPFLTDNEWSHPSSGFDQVRALLEQAVKQAEGRGQPVIPGFFPVAADGKVIYRDYWGIRVCDLRTGKVAWESDCRYSLDRMLDPHAGTRPTWALQWINLYLQMTRPGMLYENSVVGTLSTDGTRVFAVEDLYVPPGPQSVPWGGPMGQVQAQNYGDLKDAVYANQLNAYNLRTGKLTWTVDARKEKDEPKEEGAPKDPGEQDEGYFLGPPLPLQGKLYVLNEKNQDLRLLCLDPDRGQVNWVQLLATTQTKLSQDVYRRTEAAHLAYGEGILVCPTNAGMLLGVDLLSHSVVWAHPYREKGQAPQPDQLQMQMMLRQGIVPPGGYRQALSNSPEWKVTAPVVQDGRVVFTAPDGGSVRCLNLHDGTLLWKAERNEDDLYLGGVVRGKVLIVGKKECRALSLADGSRLWQAATGMPSGQGVATDRLYYLPLKDGRGQEPEVCALDVDTGKDVSHTRSRKKDVPGNLVLYEGDVLSQTVEGMTAYPQLRTKLARIDERIAKDPHDPVGLTERGELRLDNGNLPGAIEDLRAALQNHPPAGTREKARSQLFDALTDYLKDNFDAAEHYLPEYRQLCKVEVADTASGEDKQRAEAEGQHRLAGYLSLVARGREGQGRLNEAFQHYLEFANLAAGQELLSVPDERSVRAPADVWAHGRISAMIARANPRQRDELERLVTRRWDDLKDGTDTDGLRKFVKLFGSDFAVGREARFVLAERLADDGGKEALLESERELLLLARQPEDRTLAARAVEALARLNARNGYLEDAAHYYRVLGHDFGDVPVRDGKTGVDFLNDLATDKRFLPYLEEPAAGWPGSKVELQTEHGQFPPQQQLFTFEPAGDVLPFFARLRVALETGGHTLRLSDRANDDVRLETTLPRTNFVQVLMQQAQAPGGHGRPFAYHTVGHVIVLPVGHLVFGIDPLARRVLWQESLFGAQGPANPNGQVQTDPHDGSVQVLLPDGYILRVGQPGPARPAYVCLQTRDGLKTIDPLTGRTLWTRTDVPRNVHVFGDDRHVFLVALNAEGNLAGTRVFRASDGVTVGDVADFSAAYQQRQRIDGHRIYAADATNAGLAVRLYDVLAGKDVWKKQCPPGSIPVHCEDPHLGGVVEPDGAVTILDLRTGREALRAQVDAEGVDKARGATLLHDRAQWYLAIDGPQDVNNGWGGLMSNFQPGSGYRCVPVNGKVYAFDRATGKLNWASLPIPQQMLVLEQVQDLPVLLLASRSNKIIKNGVNAWASTTMGVTVVDKRTGKLLVDRRDLADNNQVQQFHTMHTDLREGRIELVSFQLKVTLTLPTGPATAEARTAASPPTP